MRSPRKVSSASRLAAAALLAIVIALLASPRARAEPPAASATASGAAAHEPAAPGAAVRIHDNRVFTVVAARAGRSAVERAAAASQVLERALEGSEIAEVRVETQGELAIVFVGATPMIQLGPEDLTASADASLALHAAAIADKTRDALRAERRRSAIATSVFSFSLVVFSALIAVLLLRKIGELAERTRGWMASNPARLPALRVRGIEVVQPAAMSGGLTAALSAAQLILQIGIAYAWVLIALSLFEATRGYTERLTGFVVTPVSALLGRVAGALPVIVLAIVTTLVVALALRFIRLFFGSVARGETVLGWLPRDLATPTSILVRAGIVVVTLVVAAPLITGTDDGALSRAGVVALVALGLASTPLLMSAAAGIPVMFGRQLRVNEFVIVGGRSGRVRATTMLEILLEDEEGCLVHVPHLLTLWHPTRVLGPSPPIAIEIAVAPEADLAKATALLEQVAARIGARPRVELASIDADGARLRVSVRARAPGARSELLSAAAAALAEGGIRLGKGTSGGDRLTPGGGDA